MTVEIKSGDSEAQRTDLTRY